MILDGIFYIIEVNFCVFCMVLFVVKVIGYLLAKYVFLVMAGKTLKEIGFTEEVKFNYVVVKEVVFLFDKFLGVDMLFGLEMRSIGEVMGIDKDFSCVYCKA